MRGHNFCWKALGFESRLIMFKVRLVAKFRHVGEASMSEGSAGRAATLCFTPQHSPYC
jgi:hypothetical protein